MNIESSIRTAGPSRTTCFWQLGAGDRRRAAASVMSRARAPEPFTALATSSKTMRRHFDFGRRQIALDRRDRQVGIAAEQRADDDGDGVRIDQQDQRVRRGRAEAAIVMAWLPRRVGLASAKRAQLD